MKKVAIVLLLALLVVGLFVLRNEIWPRVDSSPVARDPGVRGGTAGAGGPLEGLTASELEIFSVGKEDFEEEEDVPDGLGPTMNLGSCAGCHLQPSVGGTSPPLDPQISFANLKGATNIVPPFITRDGPIREARFVRNRDGTPGGGVHDLFSVAGRSDAPGCVLAQPDFKKELAEANVIFRIPTPLFGAGLIEQIPDKVILANRVHEEERIAQHCGKAQHCPSRPCNLRAGKQQRQ